MSLIRDGNEVNGLKQHPAKVAVEASPFGDTFGPKAQRKRVKLDVGTISDLAGESVKMHDSYLERLDQAKLLSGTSGDTEDAGQDETPTAREPVFSKGQSKRIWNELYKVIDSSDVVVHVLDSRDPEGTRCRSIEKYIREEVPHKHLIFVLNKCDLVPTKVAVSCQLLFSLFRTFYIAFPRPSCAIAKSRLLPVQIFCCFLRGSLSVTAMVD
jgi:nuclear GTP-binding protein